MNLALLYSRSTCSVPIFAQDLRKFGPLLRWNNHQEDILEVGCATGLVTRTVLYPHIKDRVRKFISVDKRQCMIDYAREHNQVEKIEYELMNVINREEVEKIKNRFDRIFVPFVAHWIPDNRSLLEMLRTILKPKGQIFLTIMVDTPFHKSFSRPVVKQTWAKYLPNEKVLCDYGENPCKYLTNLATSVGFNVNACESEKGCTPIENYPDFARAIINLYDNITLIPEELQEDYYRDHLKYTLKICTYLGEPDKVDLPYEKMVCVVTKID